MLKPLPLFEIPDHHKNDQKIQNPNIKISEFPGKFREIMKIHAIYSGNKGQWQKYG